MTRKRSRAKAFGSRGGAGMVACTAGAVAATALSLSAAYIFAVSGLVQAAPDAIGQQRHHTREDHECTDNPNYKSSFGGLPCEAFSELDCYAFRSVEAGDDMYQDGDGDGVGDGDGPSCVKCTNIPSSVMTEKGRTCATYSWAWTNRCNNEKSWWGKDGEFEFCQYSCWKNGSPYPNANASPCCPREDKDDDIVTADHQGSRTATALLVDELMFNCPKSCGIDECEEKSYVYWDKFFQDVQEVESVPTGTSSLSSLIPADKTRGGMLHERLNGGGAGASSYSTQHHFPTACHAGWSPSCQDDDQYRCRNGLGCNAYRGYDCTQFLVVGFSPMQVADLIAHCPCSCGKPCEKPGALQQTLTDKFSRAFIPNLTPSATPPIGVPDARGDSDCVQCTNIPSDFMLKSDRTCATYSRAWTDRCNNEESWWGKDGELEYCQYSCWKNGSPYPNAFPCCPRNDDDDIPVSSSDSRLVVSGGAVGGGNGIQLNNGDPPPFQAKPRTMDLPVEATGSSSTTPGEITVTLESQLFELTLYPMLSSLDFAAINDLSTVLDDQIKANLDDIMGPSDDRSIELNTFLLFQILEGGKLRHRRILSEGVVMGDGGVSVADAIDDAMLDLLHDGDIGEAKRTLSSNNEIASSEQSLHLGIMKIVHVTVPSIGGGEEGLYDASLVPDPDTLDLAVLMIFTNLQQSKRLTSRLQEANSQHYSSLKQVEFIGFIAEPTDSPTTSPTPMPSVSPSTSPSASPTTSPTQTASAVPSSPPTLSPTGSPTTSPSSSPTRSPTESPTNQHSDSPSMAPTTPFPTYAPTVELESSMVYGNEYELRISPVTGFLDFWAITQLIAVLNGAASSNIILPSTQFGTARVKFSTALLWQTVDNQGVEQGGRADKVRSALIVRVQTTAFVTIPHTVVALAEEFSTVSSSQYRQYLIPSIETIDEAIYASYTGGQENQIAEMLRISPAAQFQFVEEVEFQRFLYPPTPMPTQRPTEAPTPAPTTSPTTAPPTTKPSARPSASPSVSPTLSPSTSPTTSAPTMSPSKSPTFSPSESPSSSPTLSPTPLPSPGPSPGPTAPPSPEPTNHPTTSPSSKPSTSPTSSPTDLPSSMPSVSPSYYPALVAVDGNVFELIMTPVNTYLYVDAFNELNAVFDELIESNLDLVLPDSSAIFDLQISTVMSSQGLKRRDLREENENGFQDDDEDDEEIFDILRNEYYENDAVDSEVTSTSVSEIEGGSINTPRRTAIGTRSILYVRLQKTLYVSVPSIGEGGQYDPRLIPDDKSIDSATSRVFSDANQRNYFLQRLRRSSIKAFALMNEVEFTGFIYPPTEAPSSAPSSEPTPAPTISRHPSASPTSAPSPSPSAVPSASPSASPSAHPSPSPSAQPSTSPTQNPTSTPTTSPTHVPTPMHSDSPSMTPSAAPTPEPVSINANSHLFELRFSPTSMYLDYEVFTSLNYAMGEMIMANLVLPPIEQRHIEAALTLFSQFKSSSDLIVTLQLTAIVTVPADGGSGLYDEETVPTAKQLDLAIQSLLSDVEQHDTLIQRLRHFGPMHFRSLSHITLIRFNLPPTKAPTNAPTTSPSQSPTHEPTTSPTIPPKTVEIRSSIFDISLAPMQVYLDVAGVAPINAILDEMITAYLARSLPRSIEYKAVTIFLSQGLHWTSKALTVRLQTAVSLTIPAGMEDLAPDVDAVNNAVISVFLNEKLKARFIDKLGASDVTAFADLTHAVFLGFFGGR